MIQATINTPTDRITLYTRIDKKSASPREMMEADKCV